MNKIDDEIMDLIGQLTDFELDEIDETGIKSEKDNYSSKNEYLPVVKKKDSKTEEPEEDDYYSTMTDDEKERLSTIDKQKEESKKENKDEDKPQPKIEYLDLSLLLKSRLGDKSFDCLMSVDYNRFKDKINQSDYIDQYKKDFILMLELKANLSVKFILLLEEFLSTKLNRQTLIKKAYDLSELDLNGLDISKLDISELDINKLYINCEYITINKEKECFEIYKKTSNTEPEKITTEGYILLSRNLIIKKYCLEETYKLIEQGKFKNNEQANIYYNQLLNKELNRENS